MAMLVTTAMLEMAAAMLVMVVAMLVMVVAMLVAAEAEAREEARQEVTTARSGCPTTRRQDPGPGLS